MDSIPQVGIACKAAVSSGYPNSHFKELQHTLARWSEGSGDRWLVSRLKDLQRYRNDVISHRPDAHLDWFKQSKDGVPSDPGLKRLWEKSDKYFYQISGVLINSFSHKPDQTDKDKWYQTLRSEPLPDTIEPPMVLSWKTVQHIAERSSSLCLSSGAFTPVDMPATSIPGRLGRTSNIKTTMINGVLTKDIDSVIGAYFKTVQSAPLLLGQYFEDVSKLDFLQSTKDENLDVNLGKYFSDLGEDIKERAEMNYDSSWEGDFASLDRMINNLDKVNNSPLYNQVVGHISMLEKPGYKTRVVANPNNLVQKALIPFGESLSEFVNNLPEVYVTDQETGRFTAQQLLRQGHSISSVDMTAATDTIDNDIALKVLYHNLDDSTDSGKYLKRSIELFQDVSKSTWNVDDIGSDGINYVAFKRGAPLGTRPSFPLLTLTNYISAKASQRKYAQHNPGENPQFGIVGDDIFLDSRIYPDYLKNMESMGGEVNHDKTMDSNRVAEFAGYIITREDIYPKKPRFLNHDRYHNALTLGDYSQLKPWEKSFVANAKQASIYGYTQGVSSTTDIPLENRETMAAATKLLANQPESRTVEVSHDTFIRRAQIMSAVEYGRSYIEDSITVDSIIGDLKTSRKYEARNSLTSPVSIQGDPFRHVIHIPVDLSSTTYDHIVSRRVDKNDSSKSYLKALAMATKLQKRGKSTNSLLYEKITFNGSKGDLFIDLDDHQAVFSTSDSRGNINNYDVTDSLLNEVEKVDNILVKRTSFTAAELKQQAERRRENTLAYNTMLKHGRQAISYLKDGDGKAYTQEMKQTLEVCGFDTIPEFFGKERNSQQATRFIHFVAGVRTVGMEHQSDIPLKEAAESYIKTQRQAHVELNPPSPSHVRTHESVDDWGPEI